MKKSTLFFRSVLVIFLLAGSAHLVTYSSQNRNTIDKATTDLNSTSPIHQDEEIKSSVETDLTGKWKVTYNTDEFKGAIIYSIKKEKNKYQAYLVEYQDQEGYAEKANNDKIVNFSSPKDNKANGSYKYKYEGKTYDIDCIILIINNTTFELSYDYFGYSGVETWKKI